MIVGAAGNPLSFNDMKTSPGAGPAPRDSVVATGSRTPGAVAAVVVRGAGSVAAEPDDLLFPLTGGVVSFAGVAMVNDAVPDWPPRRARPLCTVTVSPVVNGRS